MPTPLTLEWLYDVTAAAPAAREEDMRGYSDTRLLDEHAVACSQRRQLLVVHATALERIALGGWAGIFGVDFEDSLATAQAFDDRLADHIQLLLDRRAL